MKATRNCIHSYKEGMSISIFAKRGKNHVVYSHPDSFTIMQDDQVTTSNNNKGMLHSLVLMTFSVQIFAIIKGTVTSWTEHLWLFQYTYIPIQRGNQIHIESAWKKTGPLSLGSTVFVSIILSTILQFLFLFCFVPNSKRIQLVQARPMT